MTDKVITSNDEFEDLNIDLDVEETTEVKEDKPVTEVKDDSDDIDINLDDLDTVAQEVPTPQPEPIHNELKKENPLEEIDIELDTSDLEKAVAEKVEAKIEQLTKEPEAPKKRGRKSKAEKEAEETVIEKDNSDVMVLDPMFSLEKINTDKYQTRTILHTSEEIDVLKEQIANQGQIEPVHLYNDGTTYHLLAGFKRHAAMKALGRSSIKAIIHNNLTEEECIAISSGSNSERTELSEYDKLISVGTFNKKNPIIPVERLVNIFGYAKSTIYQYISYFKFFDKHPEYNELFSKYRLPYFAYGAIYRAFSDEETYPIADVIEHIKDSISSGKIEKKAFENDLITKFSEAKLKARIDKENEAENLDVDIGVDDEIEDPQIEKLVKEKKTEVETKDKETLEKKDKINSILDSLNECADKLEVLVTDILAIENHKDYIDTAKLNKYVKKIGKIAGMNVKFI